MYEYDYKSFDTIKRVLDPNIVDCAESNRFVPNNQYSYHPDEREEDGYIYTQWASHQERDNGGPYFEYRYNRDGFRSQHFENFNPADLNIVYSGCSWTYGDGLPDEYVWRSVLENKIKEKFPDRNVQGYNVGTGGASIHLIFKNVMSFIRKNDDIDYLFILFPGFDRQLVFDPSGDYFDGYAKTVFMSPDEPNFEKPFVKNFVLSYVHEEHMYMYLPMIRAIEDICKLKGIKLFWSSWIPSDKKIYEKYEFDNYCDMPAWKFLSQRPKTTDNQYMEIARDGAHPGLNYMTEIANTFFKALENEE
jgi:hypothetical protein